ncbi:MAG: HAMP domain-containing histidine kinase [Lachnospiraceae bacterium]|nr:HAMP domain-containing histidine kinase [Lachnospiraceae bacterium]
MKRSIFIIIHILSVLLFAAGLVVLHDYSAVDYGLTWIDKPVFEESVQFSGMVADDIHNIKRLAVLKAAFEDDGAFSEDNLIVSAVTRNGNMGYTVGDMLTLAGRFGYTMDADTHGISAYGAGNDAANYEVRVTYKEYDPFYFDNIEPGPSQGVTTVKELSLEVMKALAEYYNLSSIYDQQLTNFVYSINFTDTSGEELAVSNTTMSPMEIRSLGKYISVNSEFSIDTNIQPQPDGIIAVSNTLEFDTSEEDVLNIGVDTTYIYNDRYKAAADSFEGSVGRVRRWLMFLVIGAVMSIVSLVPVVRGTGDRQRQYAMDRLPIESMVFLFGLLSIVIYYLFKLTVYNTVELVAAQRDWAFWRMLGRWLIIYTFAVIILSSVWRRARDGGVFRNSLAHGIVEALTDEQSGSAAWNAFKSFAAMVLLNFAGCFGILWFYMHRMEQGNYYIAFILLSIILAAVDIYIYTRLYKHTKQRASLRTAVREISEGETGLTLPLEEYSGNELELARSLNSISDGLDRAIHEQVKAERLKADLITNVSHDIRTPLTSIINYVDLIKREDIDNEKIREYVDVLDKKSARLKNLTEDLLEASKASSGNVKLEMTRLDMVELASQAGGEFEDKFAARRLELELNTPEQHAYVLADGRHLWRVFENLYNNAAKYALEGTRVYADVYSRDNNYVFTIKNVSSEKLNISPDELTERFVRGDESRSTEGSGLGLSIAKSLTKLMGGELVIEIDGDLYKASVVLPRHEEPAETTVTTGTLEIE